MHQTFFSVVIPLYNKENTIRRAVLSVLAQTYPHFELLIVDDGSSDASCQIVGEIQDRRIQFIQQANQGVSAARNKGVSRAAYPIVAFLDADDEWKPVFLENIARLTINFPDCVLFGTGYETCQENKLRWSGEEMYPALWSGVIENYLKIVGSYPFSSSSVAVKAAVLKSVGGFPTGVTFGEDVSTWLRCSLIGQFAFFNHPLVIYHREASDANTWRVDRRQEPHPVKVLKELLRDHVIPADSCSYAVDFIAKADLKAAEACFRAGEPIHAILFIFKCLPSAGYRRRIFPMLRREFLPSLKKVLVDSIKWVMPSSGQEIK